MRQILLLIFAAIAVISAETVNASSPSSDKLDKALRKQITYPQFAKSDQLVGMVLVEFEVLANGSIQVNEINASHNNLGTYVRNELEKLRIENLNEIGKHYVKFKFRFVEI